MDKNKIRSESKSILEYFQQNSNLSSTQLTKFLIFFYRLDNSSKYLDSKIFDLCDNHVKKAHSFLSICLYTIAFNYLTFRIYERKDMIYSFTQNRRNRIWRVIMLYCFIPNYLANKYHVRRSNKFAKEMEYYFNNELLNEEKIKKLYQDYIIDLESEIKETPQKEMKNFN